MSVRCKPCALRRDSRCRLADQIDDLEDDPEFDTTPKCGETHLFFGCRRSNHDFLYSAELQKYESLGVLTKLHVAFSREQAFKVYVQHRMREHGELLAKLILRNNASVFVCGDGQNMARDVHQCLQDVLQLHGNLSMKEAQDTLVELAKRGRYVKDVWS